MKRIVCALLVSVMLMSTAAAETFADFVLEANETKEEIAKALSTTNTGYQNRLAAMEKMIVYMSEGRLGSESELWDIAEAFGFDYDETKVLEENANQLYAFLSARLDWYAADDYESISSFMTSVAQVAASSYQLKELGVTWTFYSGVWTAKFKKEDLSQIVDALAMYDSFVGLTTAEFYDLYMQIGQFYEIPW